MIKNNMVYIVVCNIILIGILVPSISIAYIGPGAGLSAFGSLFSLLAAIIIAVFGFVWFPIKRFIKRLKLSKSE